MQFTYSWCTDRQPGRSPPLTALCRRTCVFLWPHTAVSLAAHACCLAPSVTVHTNTVSTVVKSKRQMSPLGFAAQMASFLQATCVELPEAQGTQMSLFFHWRPFTQPAYKGCGEGDASTWRQFSYTYFTLSRSHWLAVTSVTTPERAYGDICPKIMTLF